MRVAGTQEERPVTRRPSRHVPQGLQAPEGHFLVVVQLHTPRALPRLLQLVHRGARVRVRPLRPVRRPHKARRVDLGRQPALEPVHLVRPQEVHLARQQHLVVRTPKMVHKGRRARRKVGPIVKGPDPAHVLAGAHAGPGRRRYRAVAVRRLEQRALSRKPVKMGRLHHPVPVAPRREGRQLIRHHHQNIRT